MMSSVLSSSRAMSPSPALMAKWLHEVPAPALITQRFLRRTFHVNRWDKFKAPTAPKSGKVLQRTVSGKSGLDKHKHTVLSVSRYGGNPQRETLASAFRRYTSVDTTSYQREHYLCPALSLVAKEDIFADDTVDLEFFALYLNACIVAHVEPSPLIMSAFSAFMSNGADADDEEVLQHQAVESVISALLQLSSPLSSPTHTMVDSDAPNATSAATSSNQSICRHPTMLRRLSKRLLSSAPSELSGSVRCVLLHCWVNRLMVLQHDATTGTAATSSALFELDVAYESVCGLLPAVCLSSRSMPRAELMYFVQVALRLVTMAFSKELRPSSHVPQGSETSNVGSPPETTNGQTCSTTTPSQVASSGGPCAALARAFTTDPAFMALVTHRVHLLAAVLPWIQGASVAECAELLTLMLFLCRDGDITQDDSLDLLIHELTSLLDLCDNRRIAELLYAFELTDGSGGTACTKRYVKLPSKWKRSLKLTVTDDDWATMAQQWTHDVDCAGDFVLANNKVAFIRAAIQ